MNQQYIFPAISVVSASVAVASCLIAWRQAITSEEKLRFELYEKRFDVYSRSVDYLQVLTVWDGSDANQDMRRLFVKAMLESAFLFPPEVSTILEEINLDSIKLIGLKDDKENFYNEGMDVLEKFNGRVSQLQTTMSPYLNFHQIRKK